MKPTRGTCGRLRPKFDKPGPNNQNIRNDSDQTKRILGVPRAALLAFL